MFLNRKKELKDLSEILLKNETSLINIYGRRRIGKTFLLRELINYFDKQAKIVYYVCFQGDSEMQLLRLYDIIKEEFSDEIALKSLIPPSWFDFFTFLFELERPLVLILDEFPYIVESERILPSIIQNLWDKHNKKSKLQLILCGSSISIMKELMGSKQPLYGRFTHVLEIKPFDFNNTRLFYPKLPFMEQIYSYMIFGGIPFYHQKQTKVNSFEELLNNIFSLLTVFKDEILINLGMSTTQTTKYFSILYEISCGKQSFSKIQKATKIESNLTHYLNFLIEMGLIGRKRNFSLSGPKIVIYYIKDSFTAFWFKFFYTHERELTLLSIDKFIQTFVLPSVDEFLSIPFEDFCHQIITHISLNGYFAEPILNISNYSGYLIDSGTKQKIDFEIDIIGVGIQKKVLVLGECKWTISVDEWDIKKFLNFKTFFTVKFSDFFKKFEDLKLIFISKIPFKESLKKKYPEIDFIDLKKLEFLLDNISSEKNND